MRSMFPGYFSPTDIHFEKHWKESIFVMDANVLLNLYRYSDATKDELKNALTSLDGRVFIPHQAASEFLRNRLTVTSEQSKEYASAIKTINELVKKISSKDRHPFISDKQLNELNDLSSQIIESLNEQQNALLNKLSNDEILDFVETVFEGKTGTPFDKGKLDDIIADGAKRYEAKIPPGYKDANKDSTDIPTRKYGDLIVWLQTLEYAKEKNSSIVFITDDKKEDWWLEQSGRTIGPRPELIEEFIRETKKDFWMYTVSTFIQETARINQKELNPDIMDEIIKVSEMTKETNNTVSHHKKPISPSILVSQEISMADENENTGIIVVTLERPMRYATGSGKFRPQLCNVPDLEVKLVEGPENSNGLTDINYSYGCGTNKNFNVHLKAKSGELATGDYVFQYRAIVDDIDEDLEPQE
ncbi:PIN domain-containing protein [Aeromonas veronii]